VIGVSQRSFETHATVAVVAAPVLSSRTSGELLLTPVASFQLGSTTTPATSVDAIATSSPTKSILIGLPEPLIAVTLRVAAAVWVREPLVPVMVNVELPVGVLLAVVIVSVELPPAVMEVGLNVPVVFAGSPLTPSVIEPVKPLVALVFTV
jgi:hypothetical protein